MPFYYHGLALVPAWMADHMLSRFGEQITYLFPNFNGATDGVWEWTGDFISHIMMDVTTYPCWDWSWTMLVKGGHLFLFTNMANLNPNMEL